MIEYPSIINSSKAPNERCIAFDKLDGSNVRVKFTKKNGFELFGSRTQLFDETHPFLAGAIPYFFKNYSIPLKKEFMKREFENVKEFICFGEYVGAKSFAGVHDPEDETKKFVLFDVLLVYKGRNEFLLPQDFVRRFEDKVEIPRVVYTGTLNKRFIEDVRENLYSLNEGVICKGTFFKGNYRGKVWMAKIKTHAYLNKLQNKFGTDWQKYGE